MLAKEAESAFSRLPSREPVVGFLRDELSASVEALRLGITAALSNEPLAGLILARFELETAIRLSWIMGEGQDPEKVRTRLRRLEKLELRQLIEASDAMSEVSGRSCPGFTKVAVFHSISSAGADLESDYRVRVTAISVPDAVHELVSASRCSEPRTICDRSSGQIEAHQAPSFRPLYHADEGQNISVDVTVVAEERYGGCAPGADLSELTDR